MPGGLLRGVAPLLSRLPGMSLSFGLRHCEAARHVLYFVAPPSRLQPGQFDLVREVVWLCVTSLRLEWPLA